MHFVTLSSTGVPLCNYLPPKNCLHQNSVQRVAIPRPAGCLTPNGGSTVHMLGGVFQQAVSPVVVLDVVERDGLETPPAQWEDERVSCLQDAAMPAVLLQAHLQTFSPAFVIWFHLHTVCSSFRWPWANLWRIGRYAIKTSLCTTLIGIMKVSQIVLTWWCFQLHFTLSAFLKLVWHWISLLWLDLFGVVK